MDRAGPARLKTVELPRQKYPEACVWQPTSYLLVIWEFFVEYTFIGIWVKATFFRPGEGGELVAQGAIPQSPEKGAPGEWEEQWDDSAQATFWYNRKTGEASWVDPRQQHLLGTPER